jgi:hypothetical protein
VNFRGAHAAFRLLTTDAQNDTHGRDSKQVPRSGKSKTNRRDP